MAKRMRIRLARKIEKDKSSRYSIGKWKKALERLGWKRFTWNINIGVINNHRLVSSIIEEEANNQIFTGG